MNPEQLLAHFDRISEAPDAIPRLRRFILELAVRGKLVEQDPNDEPASELLGRLKTMIAENRNSERSRGRTNILRNSVEFFDGGTFPPSWPLTRFDSVNVISSGVAKGQDLRGLETARYPYLRVANVQRGYLDLRIVKELEIRADELDRYRLRRGDVLMTEGGDWDKLGRAAIWNEEIPNCIHQNHIFRIRPVNQEELLPTWIALFANSPLGRSYFEGASKQTTNLASINMTQLRSCPLPIPPLAEQRRIVARVDELMGLCDRLEAAQAKRERRRDRLVAASLQRLNNGAEGEELREHTSFYLNHLPRFTTRPEQVKQLRQTIRNMAVRGRLVPQSPSEEPATELVKQIQAEKARLMEAGEIKKLEASQPVAASEIPFPIPCGWEVMRMGRLARKLGAGSTPLGGKSVYLEQGIPFLRSQNVHSDGLRLNNVAFISPATHARMTGTHVQRNDILLNITGASIGRSALVPDNSIEANVSQHVAIIRLFLPSIRQFIHLSLISPFYQALIDDAQVGVSRAGLSMQRLALFPMLIPPLAEQRRIVAKVGELMGLCDRLERQLSAVQAGGVHLVESVFYHALAGNDH